MFNSKLTTQEILNICLNFKIIIFSSRDKPLINSNGLGEIEKIFLENFLDKPLEYEILKYLQELNFRLFNFWSELNKTENIQIIDILEIIKSRKENFSDFRIKEKAKLKNKTPKKINELIKLFNIQNSYPGVNLYQFLDGIK